MRILWSIHLYPPVHNCGSEYVAHSINKYLISRGHQVRVILHQAKMHNVEVPYTYEGVEVFGHTGHVDAYRWGDVILTHLDFTQYSIVMAHATKRPIVHFVHNDIPYSSIEGAIKGSYIVYNSQWTCDAIGYHWPSMVLYPPCDVDYYNVNDNPEENEFITLISLNKNKGGLFLRELANAMPERKFLGVCGSYDHQHTEQPGNVTVIPNTPDILSVYKKTRVLIMPSEYESWGRTATEAMCSGIPVICTPTPGLTENCSSAGYYVGSVLKKSNPGEPSVDRGRVEDWVAAIKELDNIEKYRNFSQRCRQRANELKPDLSKLEEFILNARF